VLRQSLFGYDIFIANKDYEVCLKAKIYCPSIEVLGVIAKAKIVTGGVYYYGTLAFFTVTRVMRFGKSRYGSRGDCSFRQTPVVICGWILYDAA